MDHLDTFEDFLKRQQVDLLAMTDDEVTFWRGIYQKALQDRAAHDVHSMFRQPPRAGEQRHAVAIEDGGTLWLALCITRSASGYYILIPRGAGPGNPHASYHRDGRYHHKSGGFKFGLQRRQPLAQFKGAEHLGSFGPIGPDSAVCDPAVFTTVLSVSLGGIDPMNVCALVDLVEPGRTPDAHHRDLPGLRIMKEEIYQDYMPWIVVAVADRTPS